MPPPGWITPAWCVASTEPRGRRGGLPRQERKRAALGRPFVFRALALARAAAALPPAAFLAVLGIVVLGERLVGAFLRVRFAVAARALVDELDQVPVEVVAGGVAAGLDAVELDRAALFT